MILIADSGSTKTDWILWDKMKMQSSYHQSKGLNPFFVEIDEIAETLLSTFTKRELDAIDKIYFYGAGCGRSESKKHIKDGLSMACHDAHIEVEHDLYVAARSLCGKEAGVACILGTGSNACVYDGRKIIKEGVSFGYIMGDEGSGNHLGRQLLKAIYTKKAPPHIIQSFEQSYPHLNFSKLLDHLYHLPAPNRFLATFSPFIRAHRNDPFFREMIAKSFHEFLDYFVVEFLKEYPYKVHFQGSIAWNYQSNLIDVLKKREIDFGHIIQHPIQQLFEYHKMME
jgi:N-acetylglucosamine kinase-like BadF-type ATPase